MATATTSLLDLISAGLLQPGNKVMVREIEGELTPQGTIISTTERGTIEYKTPTAFSKAVTSSTSGGWQQVKLKSSGGTTSLFDVKRKFAGYSSRRRGTKGRRESGGRGPPTHHHHVRSLSHIAVSLDGEEGLVKVGLNNISLPILVRFRDDDSKRGRINRVSEDFSTFELEYKGKTYHTVSSASKEMYREYADETGEVVSINSNGFEDLKYQTTAGDWLKLRELFPVEIRKRHARSTSNVHANDDDEEDEDHDEVTSENDSDPPTSPPLTPPSPSTSTPPPQQRSTMIAKHIKHSLLPSSSSYSSSDPSNASIPILPIKHPTSPVSNNGKPAPIVLSLKSPPPPAYGTHGRRTVKDIELLVHIESVDSIPYEVVGTADSYDSLRHRIAHVIPDFPFNQTHELGVYSEYWEKHAGVAYVKPPRSWIDFPACTTLLLKKIPETIIIGNMDL